MIMIQSRGKLTTVSGSNCNIELLRKLFSVRHSNVFMSNNSNKSNNNSNNNYEQCAGSWSAYAMTW